MNKGLQVDKDLHAWCNLASQVELRYTETCLKQVPSVKLTISMKQHCCRMHPAYY